MNEQKEGLTVHGKMAKIKKELAEKKIEKSGHNKFAGFHYHELSDFISHINELNLKHGVNDLVEINEECGYCKITLVNVENSDDKYSIVTPYREAEMLAKGGAPSKTDAIQRIGSTITYNRRYLYMTAYNIQENDGVDSQEPEKGTKKPAPKKPTRKTSVEIKNGKAKKDFSKPFGEVIQAVLDGEVNYKTIVEKFNVTDEQLKQLKEADAIKSK